ncbi:hypothetical protein HNQ92_004913 [Rhabdobacter roseus]|uniref:Glycosyltransferase RgtA/B/C/D-like domain-containing protein n=1 Tax=Rhabdobacter roseus TaxID=1655419 RepID=A0A840TYR3_9BACT|nr:hypothetical protein [Rhabdobacter roseus]
MDSAFWRVKLIGLALAFSAGSLFLFNSILIERGLLNLYYEMRHPGSIGGLFWDDIIEQGQDPFTQKNYEPGTHEANQTFRITIPLIARFLHLNVATLYLLHLVLGIPFLLVLTGIVEKILRNKIHTFYFLTGFTAIYAGSCFYINYLGHADIFPFLFMLLMLRFRHPAAILLFSQLAFWCDERALINSSFIGLWYLWPVLTDWEAHRKLVLRRSVVLPVAALVASGVLYLLIRTWMEHSLGLFIGHDSELSKKTFFWSLSIFGDKITRGYEGMWLIILGAFVLLILVRRWWTFVLLAGAWLLNLIVAILVADGTRALSFGFIGLLLCLCIMAEHLPPKQIKYVLIVSTLFSLMLPLSFP